MSRSKPATTLRPVFGAPLPFPDLVELCQATGLRHQVNQQAGYITFLIDTEDYRSPVGNECVVINVCANENAPLTIWAPWVYRLSQAVDRTAFICALSEVSFRTNLAHYAYDPGDQQEVRVSLQLHMIDFKPSARFIGSHVLWLARLIDARHAPLAKVAAYGARALPEFRASLG